MIGVPRTVGYDDSKTATAQRTIDRDDDHFGLHFDFEGTNEQTSEQKEQHNTTQTRSTTKSKQAPQVTQLKSPPKYMNKRHVSWRLPTSDASARRKEKDKISKQSFEFRERRWVPLRVWYTVLLLCCTTTIEYGYHSPEESF